MAQRRDYPYSQFNFTVNIENGPEESSIAAGFQEVTGLGLEITMAEYRNGNDKTNEMRKIPGLFKVPDVTLKRGVIGELDTLHNWIRQFRNGEAPKGRTVTISLYSEQQGRTTVAQTWKLSGAQPMKYTGPSLNAKGTDVAIEELVLSCTNIDFE
jgi:phage tail-like protein